MTARLATVLLLAGFAGCAGLAPSGGPLVLEDGRDDAGEARRIARAGHAAEVIYLGEQHDNPTHHARQRLILEAVVDDRRPTAVGFEMLNESRQDEVDRALARNPGREELSRALGWPESGWPDFAMYWPLFELALRERLPVLALDLDREATRLIARQGLAAAGDAGARLRSLLPPDAAREAEIAETMARAHCGMLPAARIPSMVEAWHARNVAMARRIAQALDQGRRVVVIVGRGHQAPGGLPAQLAALRPGTRQYVVDLVEAPPDVRPAVAGARSIADAVWASPPIARRDPCAGRT